MGLRNTVNPGDRFEKVENTNTLTVARLVDLPNHPTHAVLTGEWQHTGEILISVSALLDPKLYRRVHD